MTTVAPVNQRASVVGVRHDAEWTGEKVPAGEWKFYSAHNDRGGKPVGILFGCPCGCGTMQAVGFKGLQAEPAWTWDGNEEKPTLSPSINILQMEHTTGRRVGEHWHGWLQNGEWRSV